MAIKFDKQKRKEIQEVLTSTYIHVDGIERNKELENSIIRKNKVNFKLTVNLSNDILDEWKKLPNNCKTTGSTELETGVYQFKYSSFVKEGIVASPSYTINKHYGNFRIRTLKFGHIYQDIHTKKSDFLFGGGPRACVTQDHINICHPSIEKNDEFIPGKDIFYSDDALEEAIDKILPNPEELDYKHDFSNLPCPMVKYYAQRHQKELDDAVEYLAKWYTLDESSFSTKFWFDRRTGWRKHKIMIVLPDPPDPPDEEIVFIPFKDKKDKKGYISSYVILDKKQNTLLPCTAWTKEGIDQRHYHNLPPASPMLRNLDLIKSNKGAVIFITDSLEIEYENTIASAKEDDDKSEIIWTSWYGENETVKNLDWTYLIGRNVVYFITSHTAVSLEKAYKTASDAYSKLQNIKLKSLYFVEKVDNDDYVVYDANEFSLRAASFCSEQDDYSAGSPIPIERLLSQDIATRRFLLEPIILEKSTTLLYAPTNVGKTWLAMIIGTAIASGGTVFKTWRSPKRKRVLYIDTEMEPQSFRDRISMIMKMKFNGKKLSSSFIKQNFFYKSKKRSSANNESFQNEITKFVKTNKISFVVLDNLAAFTRHNDSAKAWEDIHSWLDALKSHGCSALVVHHTNKSGEAQRGSSATTNAVDNVIKVNKESINDDNSYEQIGMSINIEKGRDIYGKSRKSFKFKICPNQKPPECNLWDDENDLEETDVTRIRRKSVRLLTEDQKQKFKNEVIKDLKAGLTILEIAKKHGVSKEKIYHIEGICNHPAYNKMVAKKEQKKRVRKHDIINAYRQNPKNTKTSKIENVAKTFHISKSTVYKIIEQDNKWLVEKHYKIPAENGISDISREVGLSEKEVTRCVNYINYSRVSELYAQKKDIAYICKQTKLSNNEISKIIEEIKQEEFNKSQSQIKRKQGIYVER